MSECEGFGLQEGVQALFWVVLARSKFLYLGFFLLASKRRGLENTS